MHFVSKHSSKANGWLVRLIPKRLLKFCDPLSFSSFSVRVLPLASFFSSFLHRSWCHRPHFVIVEIPGAFVADIPGVWILRRWLNNCGRCGLGFGWLLFVEWWCKWHQQTLRHGHHWPPRRAKPSWIPLITDRPDHLPQKIIVQVLTCNLILILTNRQEVLKTNAGMCTSKLIAFAKMFVPSWWRISWGTVGSDRARPSMTHYSHQNHRHLTSPHWQGILCYHQPSRKAKVTSWLQPNLFRPIRLEQ